MRYTLVNLEHREGLTTMNEHFLYLAQHLLRELNKLGIVKDAQVNNTTHRFMAGEINQYMKSQRLQVVDAEPET